MNLYKIKRTDSVGYDEYDSAVVVAPNEDEARKIHPARYQHLASTWTDWTNQPETLKVEYVGKAAAKNSWRGGSTQQGVVAGA